MSDENRYADAGRRIPSDDPQNEHDAGETAETSDTVRLQTELAEQRDRYLRLAADFDNFRKRSLRDSDKVAASEKESFILELLPVLDNLERALAASDPFEPTPLREGVALTVQQMIQLLSHHGIMTIEDLGQRFDPHRHEAIYTRNDPNQPDQAILEVALRGYSCGDLVFRAAKVVVNVRSRPSEDDHAR